MKVLWIKMYGPHNVYNSDLYTLILKLRYLLNVYLYLYLYCIFLYNQMLFDLPVYNSTVHYKKEHHLHQYVTDDSLNLMLLTVMVRRCLLEKQIHHAIAVSNHAGEVS